MNALRKFLQAVKPAPATPYAIQYNHRYWNGNTFVKSKAEAIIVRGQTAAWDYVDETFSEDVGEKINLYPM